jgi:hypothetical protein
VALWTHIQLVVRDRPIPVFTVIPMLYTITECPLESLLESLFKSLFESLPERASHRKE